MTDTPTNPELVERMIQACKNIIFATSRLHSPEDVAKDDFAIENMETCMVIILESYDELNQVSKGQLGKIDWEEPKVFAQALRKREKDEKDFKLLYRLCKDYIPTLQNKLSSEINNIL